MWGTAMTTSSSLRGDTQLLPRSRRTMGASSRGWRTLWQQRTQRQQWRSQQVGTMHGGHFARACYKSSYLCLTAACPRCTAAKQSKHHVSTRDQARLYARAWAHAARQTIIREGCHGPDFALDADVSRRSATTSCGFDCGIYRFVQCTHRCLICKFCCRANVSRRAQILSRR